MRPLADGTLPPEGSPYWIALKQFEDAAQVLGLDERISNLLRQTKRELRVKLPGHNGRRVDTTVLGFTSSPKHRMSSSRLCRYLCNHL